MKSMRISGAKIMRTYQGHQKRTIPHTADATATRHGYQKLKDGFYDTRLRRSLQQIARAAHRRWFLMEPHIFDEVHVQCDRPPLQGGKGRCKRAATHMLVTWHSSLNDCEP